MNVLIVGFGRSGTTLTYRIFRHNPRIRGSFLETCLLYFFRGDKLYRNYPSFKIGACEKVIYGGDYLRKRKFGTLDISIVDYCNMWLDRFGDDCRIIHIIRYPLDSIYSLIAKKGRKLGLYKGFKIHLVPSNLQEDIIKGYLNVVPKYAKQIAGLPKTLTVKYEDIILEKGTIGNMYKFCNLPRVSFPEELRTTRVFGYKRTGFNIDDSVNHIVDTFNEICPKGVRYEYPSG